MMRLGFDATVLHQAPHAGTARYARELLGHMSAAAPPGWEVARFDGWPRWRSGAAWARIPRRAVNFMAETGWLTGGALAAAATSRLASWFGPANALPWLLPRPGIVTIHDVNVLTVADSYDGAYARYAAAAMRRSAKAARRVITNSRSSREDLIAHFGLDRAHVRAIHPGADHLATIVPAQINLTGPWPYALFVGQSEPHKNIGLLVDAWRAGVPDELHLVLAGPAGRDDPRLRALVAHVGLSERIHFMGLVDDAALARLYADARIFVLPSLAEGFGFPPLEAMARGVPTAVANIPTLVEVTQDGAKHFDPRDADGLAQLVTRMSADDDLRQQLSVSGLRVAGSYRWSDAADAAWEEVLHAIQD